MSERGEDEALHINFLSAGPLTNEMFSEAKHIIQESRNKTFLKIMNRS